MINIKLVKENIYKALSAINSLLPEEYQFEKKETPIRGAPHGEISQIMFEKITNILNYRRGTNQKTAKDLEEYIMWVEDKRDALGRDLNADLSKHIIVETEKDEHGEPNNSVKITVKNLHLSTHAEEILDLDSSFPASFSFEHNTFHYVRYATYGINSKFNIYLHGRGVIKFSHNLFQRTQLFFQNAKSSHSKSVEIKNNEIRSIKAYAHTQIFFKRYNKIEEVDIVEEEKEGKFSIRWTPYQEIDSEGKCPKFNRESFIVLKERAVRKGDRFQEAVINREILKCESVLFHPNNENALRQDRLIMWFGNVVSDHGVSWWKPLKWLICFNALLALVIFLITGIGWCLGLANCPIGFWQGIYVFIEMFNPISNLTETTRMNNIVISFFNIAQKIIFALLTYELIRVGRRFTPK